MAGLEANIERRKSNVALSPKFIVDEVVTSGPIQMRWFGILSWLTSQFISEPAGDTEALSVLSGMLVIGSRRNEKQGHQFSLNREARPSQTDLLASQRLFLSAEP